MGSVDILQEICFIVSVWDRRPIRHSSGQGKGGCAMSFIGSKQTRSFGNNTEDRNGQAHGEKGSRPSA